MAEIHVLPGIERRDLLDPVDMRTMVEVAIQHGVTDGIIVGRDRHGDLYVAITGPDVDRAAGMLSAALYKLASITVVHEVIDTEAGDPA